MRRDSTSLEQVQSALSTLRCYCRESICEDCVFNDFCSRLYQATEGFSLDDFAYSYGNIIDEILAKGGRR